ncbi:hypothetical protein BJ508DRAFT_109156 [Ascobolus immersus RN42]|uniref:Uncharacterized protein n=1 Tax=Ascobolus immersus RN42 TaxID=1160509 RepID=A0A3N4HFE8_ASCIM|nr:hypothetical protein BJ508DRAFT_109156 [Ascobolus immersus RN42]
MALPESNTISLAEQVFNLAPEGRKIKGLGHALMRFLNLEIDYPFWEDGTDDSKVCDEYRQMMRLPGLSDLDAAYFLHSLQDIKGYRKGSNTFTLLIDYEDRRLHSFYQETLDAEFLSEKHIMARGSFLKGWNLKCNRNACRKVRPCPVDLIENTRENARFGRFADFFVYPPRKIRDNVWSFPSVKAELEDESKPCPTLYFTRFSRDKYSKLSSHHHDLNQQMQADDMYCSPRSFTTSFASNYIYIKSEGPLVRLLWSFLFDPVTFDPGSCWTRDPLPETIPEANETKYLHLRSYPDWLRSYQQVPGAHEFSDDYFLQYRLYKVLNMVTMKADSFYFTERRQLIVLLLKGLFSAFEMWWEGRKGVEDEMTALVQEGKEQDAADLALRYVTSDRSREDMFRIKRFADNLLFVLLARSPSVDERILRYLGEDSDPQCYNYELFPGPISDPNTYLTFTFRITRRDIENAGS